MNNGNRIAVEIAVLTAEKLVGEISRRAILAKRKSLPQIKTAVST